MESLLSLSARLDKILQSRGIEYFILYVKDTRGNLMNYLSGSTERLSRSRTTKDGIPIILGDLIPLIRGKSYLAIAMIFTILFSTRAFSIGKRPDISPITDPFTGSLSGYDKYMVNF